MSKVIEILMNEHKEIVKFVGNLRLMCLDFINHNKIDINEFRKSIHFIKTYADERHHQKEEQILFQSMVEHLGVRAENIIKYAYAEKNLFTGIFTQRKNYALDMQNALKGFYCTYAVLFKTGAGCALSCNGAQSA